MIRAIVVDDEALTSEHIARLLTKQSVEVLGCYDNAFDVLEALHNQQPDVLFLDIEMPEITGMELAEKLRINGYTGEIVFITAYNQYALQAFDVDATDYLLKPVMEDAIVRAIQRVSKHHIAATRDVQQVKISLFGKVSVYVNDEFQPIRWKTMKCVELFVYMLLQAENNDVSKWKIIDAIWPNNTKESADTNFRSTISRLNKTLREYQTNLSVISTGSGYRLQRNDVELQIDARQLEALAVESSQLTVMNIQNFEQVIQNYRGMLLDELDSEWCVNLRLKFHLYFVKLTNECIAYFEREQVNPLKVLQMTERWKQFDLYDDRLRKIELNMYYQLDGIQGVQKYYVDYVRLLQQDLGVEPTTALQAHYKKLLEQP
ncbi:response regulator [Lysinibacillus piscis]|uniref:Response regulatory domain-containing protein n=1 Tax=Lysinibacillus piscis TaxID=2518931 RepID=A0ABQ5NH72_9BACI|nr:response regulator [Lysinibacillus sp. KH24]GLC87699.1 hypothetical protein LYSBPC_08260 [Lysinibacillus sp. KH24]